MCLAGGSRSSEGRVEIWVNGTWGTICPTNFSTYDAQVICRVLGYDGIVNAIQSNVFGVGEYPPLFTLECTGSEESIQNCLISNSFCLVATGAGVKCYNGQWCTCLTSVHIYILPLWLCMQLFCACFCIATLQQLMRLHLCADGLQYNIEIVRIYGKRSHS